MLKKAKVKDIKNCLFQDEKSIVPQALDCLSEMYLPYKVTCRSLCENKQMYPCQMQNNVEQFSGGLKVP